VSDSSSPAGSTGTAAVRVRQLWQDMAPDMVARERMLRVAEIGDTHADCVVEHDTQGTAGRTARIALRRFAGSAFRLVEEAVDDTDQIAHAQFLKAMAEVQGANPLPAAYAAAALKVHKDLLREANGGPS
jgi:Family of unknown function (DUF6354)